MRRALEGRERMPTEVVVRRMWGRQLELQLRLIARRAEAGLTVVYLLRRAIAVARRARDFGTALELRGILEAMGRDGSGRWLAGRPVADRVGAIAVVYGTGTLIERRQRAASRRRPVAEVSGV